jgi:acyl dehydratase
MNNHPVKDARFYEDFEIGDVYRHPLGRTILAADNTWLSLLTMNTNPLHFDYHYSAKTLFGKPLVDSCITLAILTGQLLAGLAPKAAANLGWDEVVMPNPVFEGDTIYSQSEVLEKRESESRTDAGAIRIKTTGYNQNDAVVMEFKHTFLVHKRGLR